MPPTPIRLIRDRQASRQLPEVPWDVADAFGSKTLVVLQRGRWTALVQHEGEFRLARLVDDGLRVSAKVTAHSFGQLLDTDEHGRTLVVGGKGESLFVVEPDGSARCLGVMTDEAWTRGEQHPRFYGATWLADGGVAALLWDDLCIYAPTEAGPFEPRSRVVLTGLAGIQSIRRLPGFDALVIAADDRLLVVALEPDGGVRELARFEDLQMVSVEYCLDETGNRLALLDGPMVFFDGDVGRLEGVDEALAARDQFPLLPAAESPAPVLARGDDRPAPTAELTPKPSAGVQPDALLEPDERRLGSLTRAMIRMLRSATARSAPDMEMLKLIRPGMSIDLRAFVHVWATHSPAAPAVYEFWLAAPRMVTEKRFGKFVGKAIHLGILASGEPVFAQLANGPSYQVVMIDEEGVPYRYRGIEGFLQDLRMRCKETRERGFELDAWMDEAPVVP